MNELLAHHRLRVWHEAVGLVRLVGAHRIGNAELRDQAMRAATSCALNIAEGAAREGRSKRLHYSIARGSLTEAVAAYELADALGESVPLVTMRERGLLIAAMLGGLLRR